jgi:hypothetical protein
MSESTRITGGDLSLTLEEIENWLITRVPHFEALRRARAARALLRELDKGPCRRRGRPHNPVVTRAVELKRAGVPWFKIARQLIPGYDQLNADEQRCRSQRLYHAAYLRDPLAFRNGSHNERC